MKIYIILLLTLITLSTTTYPIDSEIQIKPAFAITLSDFVKFGMNIKAGYKCNKHYIGGEFIHIFDRTYTQEQIAPDEYEETVFWASSTVGQTFNGGGITYLYDIVNNNDWLYISAGGSVGLWFDTSMDVDYISPDSNELKTEYESNISFFSPQIQFMSRLNKSVGLYSSFSMPVGITQTFSLYPILDIGFIVSL